MISSLSDYKFVYGDDFAKIKVDGSILPLRNDPADKTPLRGEDIAFLIEANRDISAFGTAGMTREQYIAAHPKLRHEFTRKLSFLQLQEALIGESRDGFWVKPTATFPLTMRPWHNPGTLAEIYPSAYYDSSDFSPIEYSRKLTLAPIANSFANLAKMKRIEVDPNTTYGAYSYSWTENTGEESYRPFFTGDYIWAHDYTLEGVSYVSQSGSSTIQGSQSVSPQKVIACASSLKAIVKIDFNYQYTRFNEGSPDPEIDDYRCYFFVGMSSASFNISSINVDAMIAASGRTPLHYTGGSGAGVTIWQRIEISLSDVYYIATYDGRCSW